MQFNFLIKIFPSRFFTKTHLLVIIIAFFCQNISCKKSNKPDKNLAENTTFAKNKITKTAYEIRDYIRKNNKPKPNYVGGRTFKNLEKKLPSKDTYGQKIYYREWDIHKKIKGKNRGAERLVTGSDGNDYYTKNHYKSFEKLDANHLSEIKRPKVHTR